MISRRLVDRLMQGARGGVGSELSRLKKMLCVTTYQGRAVEM